MSESFIKWLNRIFVGEPQKDLEQMNKIELERKGREVGIELDRRLKKSDFSKTIKKKIGEIIWKVILMKELMSFMKSLQTL